MIIAITGTPGAGKSKLAWELKKRLNAELIDITEFVKKRLLYDGFDEEKDCLIVDENKLASALQRRLKEVPSAINIIIDGHMSHFTPSKLVDLCVVCTCNIKTLNERLKARGYNKSKIKENVESEIFRVCEEEAKNNYGKEKVLVLDSSKKTPEQLADLVVSKMKQAIKASNKNRLEQAGKQPQQNN